MVVLKEKLPKHNGDNWGFVLNEGHILGAVF